MTTTENVTQRRNDTLIGLLVRLLSDAADDQPENPVDTPMEEWPEYQRARRLLGDSEFGITDELAAYSVVRDNLDEWINRGVRRARHEQVSWEAIGASLGVTKQAAQQRYGG